MKDLNNKTIWIIGVTDGIGKALVEKLDAKYDIDFILSSRSIDKLNTIKSNLKNNTQCFDFDVADYNSFNEQASKALALKPDCIVYLPAFYEPSQIDDLKLSIVEKTIQVNLTAVFYLIDIVLPFLKSNPTSTLAITASVAGYIGLPRSQPYAATKAGVINLVESLKAENQDLDIKLINPSFVKTKLTDKNNFKMPMLMSAEGAADEIIKGLTSKSFEIHFNKRFTRILKLISMLPYSLYFKIARKMK